MRKSEDLKININKENGIKKKSFSNEIPMYIILNEKKESFYEINPNTIKIPTRPLAGKVHQ